MSKFFKSGLAASAMIAALAASAVPMSASAQVGSGVLNCDAPGGRQQAGAFATQFDPQPMHIDKVAAAEGRFGGLIASGWHVCSRVMREFVDAAYFGATPLLGMNVNELWWVRPVRPGDALTPRREILEVRPSRSQPDRGVVRTKTWVTNQDGDLVMSFENQMQLPRNAEAKL